MPNWCSNNVTITGDTEEVRAFVDRIQDNPGPDGLQLLQTFVPMPSKYVGTVEGSPRQAADDGLTWWDWQIKNWGVKWGDTNLFIDDACDDYVILNFSTPWGPPVEGLLAISRLFPSLTIVDDWDEESPSKGYLSVRGGVVLTNQAVSP
jgi:hypothetical protein